MPILQFEDIQIDTAQLVVRRNGDVMEMEPKSFRLLMYLVENRARVVPKDELVQQIWNGAFVTDNALTRSIAQIRKALGDDARQARFVETVPTVGYRFIGDVRELNLEPTVEPLPPAPIAGPPPVADPRKWPVWWIPAAIAMVATIAVVLMARPWNKSTPGVWKANQFTTGPGLDTHPSFSPDGSAIVYASDRTGRFEVYIKQLARGGREIALTSDGKENIEPAWSPEGSNIAYVSVRERGIFVVSSLGGQPRRLTDFGSQPTWSPDGSRIVFRSEALVSMAITDMPPNRDTTLWSISAEGGKAQALLTPEMLPGRASAPAFSPDRRHLAFLLFPPSGPPTICEMDLQTRRVKTIPTGDSVPFSFVYDADGTTNYYVGFNIRDGTQGLYRLRRDRQTRMPVSDPTVVTNIDFVAYRELAISNQGKKLAYAATSTVSNLWQVRRDGESKALVNERTFRLSSPVFSPTGDKIAYMLRRRGQYADIYVSDADGSNSFQLTKQHAANFMPSWMPDGQGVVYVSARSNQRGFYMYSMRDGGEHKLADLDTVPGFSARGIPMGRLSPDGTQVLFHREEDSMLQVWKLDLPTRKYTQLTFDKRPAGYPLWSPDGREVVFELLEGDSTNMAIIPATGGPVRKITHERGHVWPFSYSPDGKELAVAAKLDEPWNIYAVNVATGKMRKLTDNRSLRVFLRYPSWSPKGDPIAFERNETTGNVYLTDVP
jgi:Tol biopolymer transport system component/DNA-binding winged helix-turn-helix (wHTH) protein